MRMDIFVDGSFPILVMFFLVVGGTGTTDSSTQHELALLGKSISLKCPLEPLVTTVSWKKEDEIIFQHKDRQTSTAILKKGAEKTSEINRSQRKVTLTINYVHYNDSGQYVCSQFPESGREKISVFNLLVYGYPQLSVEPIILKEDETLNSSCCVTSSTITNEITISWLLGGKQLLQLNKTTYRKMKNGLVRYCSNGLEILASRYIHGKNLTCLVGNKYISASQVVNVLYPSTVKISTKPLLTIYDNDKGVPITCEANGNPQPQVLLQKKDKKGQWNVLEIGPMKSIKEKNITYTFYFGNASDDIKGMYRCIAFNDVGEAAMSETVEVEYYNSKKNVSTILLILVLLVIAVLVLIKVIKTKRLARYEYYMDATRNFYRRHIQGLSNSLRRRTASCNSGGNTGILPDICSHSNLHKGGTSAVGHTGKTDTTVKTSNTLSKPQRTFGNLHLSRKGKVDNADNDSGQIYANVSIGEGSSKPNKEEDELEMIPQYATLSKTGNLKA